MIRDLLKWVAPGLCTVVGGTVLCLGLTSENIASDLAGRSASAMQASGYQWAEIRTDARDLAIKGTAASSLERDAAVSHLAALSGVRSVAADITVAPLASPYLLVASLEDGGINLAGTVPDDATLQQFRARGDIVVSDLVLSAGLPERGAWQSGVDFAIEQLKHLDQGQVALADLAINVSGRASSQRAYGDLLIALRDQRPSGVSLGQVAIVPPLESPYRWDAKSDGKQIFVTGFVPDETVIERQRTASISGLPIATGLSLGSGQPENFAELSQTLIEQLSRLEYGEASIVDGVSTLTGALPNLAVAGEVIQLLAQAGSIVVLDPPRIADYWVSATRQSGGVIVFDGYAPDEATRQALSGRPNADTQFLKLGRGAPARYQSGVDFGLAALDRMSEGRFALHGDVVTLSGIARSGADYAALLDTLAGQVPHGLTLNTSDIAPPRAAQYQWQATKDASGAIVLSGMVPSPQAKDELVNLTGATASPSLTYASGEPNRFLASAETGMGLLQWLSEGQVAFDGTGWLITGTAKSNIDNGAIQTDFTTRNLAASGWSMAVAAPTQTASVPVAPVPVTEPVAPPVAAAEPAAAPAAVAAVEKPAAPAVPAEQPAAPPVALAVEEPAAPAAESVAVDPDYAFSATRGADKAVIMSGQVPDDASLRLFSTISGGDTASVSIAPGAPEGFAADAEAGLRALILLDEGQIDLAEGKWSLKGAALDAVTRDAVLADIAALPNGKSWTLNVTVPAVEPEPIAVAPKPIAVAPKPSTAKADTAACIAPLAEFSARNAILFQSGAAIIAAASLPAIDELAGDLAACPDSIVHIEGYTDSDGDDALNLALSVARAEAVVSALVERGVTPARLYAIGYGEANPIADNGTADGKRLNRRIVVTVLDQHY